MKSYPDTWGSNEIDDDRQTMATLYFDLSFLDDNPDDSYHGIKTTKKKCMCSENTSYALNLDFSFLDDDDPNDNIHLKTDAKAECICNETMSNATSLFTSTTASTETSEDITIVYVDDASPSVPSVTRTVNDTDHDFSWCEEAASRIMISVEVYGKLLQKLRDGNRPKPPPKRYNFNRHSNKSTDTSTQRQGWMTHFQILQSDT
jgi:hypothetical protein